MKKDAYTQGILGTCPLFTGIDEADREKLLDCIGATQKKVEKNGFVCMAGEPVRFVEVVLSGAVHIVQDDFWGNRVILARIEPGDLFGEAFSCAEIAESSVSVMAVEESLLLLIDYRKILTTCSSVCGFHEGLIKNMVRILAERNIMLVQKIEHITRHTTREKLLSYLSSQARRVKSNVFDIPFNRQELAEYLSVDRSAMSNELSKMRDDGIVRFQRNHFELL
ncbi:MAG: Crp/Fnr family transcriptional regulator [Treponema sp.]|nr:Crp/Fnr family transcriptional regulator [Treponema sp.]